jgi:nitrite reductase/ring-hydroxylating ferredoxin subunit
MALRFLLCRRAELPAHGLVAFAVDGVTWPVLAGVIDGELIATAGVCPHEDVSLAGGHTGACLHDASLVLRRYKITTEGDDVWIELL